MNISKNQSGYLRIHIYEDVVCQKNEQNSTGYLVLINFINFTFSIFQSLLLILSYHYMHVGFTFIFGE